MSFVMSKSKSAPVVPVLLAMVLLLVLQDAVPTRAQTGQASYYSDYGEFACDGFEAPDSGLFAAAGNSNPDIWQGGAACGSFYDIECTGNGCENSDTITVQIIDLCDISAGCAESIAFDLSEQAFSSIADIDTGVITVTYSQN